MICLPGKLKNINLRSHAVSPMEARFNAIFREQEYKLYTLALRLTKSDEYSKDIIQEVFLKLWKQRDRIHEIDNVEAWLYRVTENKVMDFLRKASANDRLKKAIWHNLQEIVNDTEAQVETKELNILIQNAIEQLPARRKIIYRLNREKGLSYQEIADELHISRHTIKNQLHESAKFIRKFLSGLISLILFFFL
ncbi:MAG: RNA polymerase sigma-70 factor [Ferruginibacter sp.]